MAEITRHRLASFCVESQRYVCMDGEIAFVHPLFCESDNEAGEYWRSCMKDAEQDYHHLLLLYKSPKTEAASRGAGQLIAKVVQWKGNGLTDHPKSFALATESVSQPSIVQRSICAGRVPSGTLESANR